MKIIIINILLCVSLLGSVVYSDKDLVLKNDIFLEIKTQKPANGLFRECDRSGKLKSEIMYKDGKFKKGKSYYMSGKLESEIMYKNGKPVNGRSYYGSGEI